jgi:hypothetical protein
MPPSRAEPHTARACFAQGRHTAIAAAERSAAEPTTGALRSCTISAEMMLDKLDMSATEIRAHLLLLSQERAAAEHEGLDADGVYMAQLEAEVLAFRHALVGAMVTEIAVLRGELFGRVAG